MSEYQYYEFQAIDRPLDRDAQEALRAISSRARITATSFTNRYDWGDLNGDPAKFMDRWFDLHLYLANWGSRRLMMRLPKHCLDLGKIEPFLREADWVTVRASGDNFILDISPETEGESDGGWDDGAGWLAALAPLRADVMSGDLRLFYLLWLMAVEWELIPDDEVEPLPGIGPVTGALDAFAEFFGIDADLVAAAGESGTDEPGLSPGEMRAALAAIAEDEKTELLLRLVEGDLHVAAELKGRLRDRCAAPETPRRTVGEVRARMQEIGEARDRAEAERQAAEQRRNAEQDAASRRARIATLKRRGEAAWQDVEAEIERRNAPGYDCAAGMLVDLQVLAGEEKTLDDFDRRLVSLRARHERKRAFIERLAKFGGAAV